MFKRVLLILCLTSVCSFIIGALEGFALDNKQNLEKDAKLELAKKETKSEPHFDLPRKDAKDQCEEVERVVRECGDISNKVFNKPYSCGNVYIRIVVIGDPFFEKMGDNVLVLDQNNKPIGINEDYANAIVFGDYKNNFTVLPQNFDQIPKEHIGTFIKHQKRIPASKIKFRINNCYIKKY